MDNLIYVGYLSKTHKLAGSIRMVTTFEYLDQLIDKSLILKKDDMQIIKRVSNIKGKTQKSVLIDFEGVYNIDLAKEILSYKVYVRSDLIVGYEKLDSLLDYLVYEEGKFIGVVTDVLNTNAHEILVINNEEKEIMIPNIDVFVKNIDKDKEKIEVKTIEGML